MTRRNFTPKTKALIRERSGGVCEVHLVPRCMYPALPEACKRQGAEVDHITPAYVRTYVASAPSLLPVRSLGGNGND